MLKQVEDLLEKEPHFEGSGLPPLKLQEIITLSDIHQLFRKNHLHFGENEFTSSEMHKGKYIGQMDENGKYHGIGVLAFADGEIQEGRFENNELNGYARVTFPDGMHYTGMFKDHDRNGYGQVYVDGTEYKGLWENNNLIKKIWNY